MPDTLPTIAPALILDVTKARAVYISKVTGQAFADREYRPNSRFDDAQHARIEQEAAADWDAAEGRFLQLMSQYVPGPVYDTALEYALDHFTNDDTELSDAVWTAFREAGE
jgi:hypothetical protein